MDISNKLTMSRKTADIALISFQKLDSGWNQPKITAYGRFAPKKKEKEKKQSFQRLAQLSCIAASCFFSFHVRYRKQSEICLFSRSIIVEILSSRAAAGFGESSSKFSGKKRALAQGNRPAKF